MGKVQQIRVPEGSFLDDFAQQDGVYTDCFMTEADAVIPFADFVEAFYTTRLFKAERLILRVFAGAPSSDDQARQLAQGKQDQFAVWKMRERADNQLLMKAIGRTSSWFMAIATQTGGTQLMFGSVVVPEGYPRAGAKNMGVGFSALLGMHKLYSRLLLAAALRRVMRAQNP